MKKLYTLALHLAIVFLFIKNSSTPASAQCGAFAGYSQAQTNWDNLDYLVTSGYYAGSVTPGMAGTQNFAIGPNRLTIAISTGITLGGENVTHTGELATYTGADVQYTPTSNNRTITLTFLTEVRNANFTLYDVDNLAVINLTAVNAAAVPQTITVTTQAGTVITVGGTPLTRTLTANGTDAANTSNAGSATINVAGPVRTITITITTRGSDPVFWLSDVNACVTGSYAMNYYNINRPFTGMPSYVLGILNNSVYMVNPANGKAKFLFADYGHTNINSTAYDPVNRIFYYAYSIGTYSASTNRTLRKWTYDTETLGIVTTDLPALLGIPSFDVGLASAANNFYDGKLYYGVEAHKLSSPDRMNGQRENIIWRVDLDASQMPVSASQVYARQADGGGTLLHDWADVTTVDGIMYDFNSSGADSSYTHYNLMTGAHTKYVPPATDIPRQSTVDWTGQVYCIGGEPASVGYIVPYNYDGTLNNALRDTITIPPSSVPPTGSWGDGGEAFRPLCDFGDAPATYDPDPWSPAVNERDTMLRIGATFDREWLKTSSLLANADGGDEDGVATVPIFATFWATYNVQVSVFNNTGVNARLIGWLDYNGNGVFDAGEASGIATIPTSSFAQNYFLTWTGIVSSLTPGTYTYLRVRLASDSLNMTAANATGWFDNGETEDYRVPVQNVVLPITLLSFTAKTMDGNTRVKLNWSASGETDFQGYEVQRSSNGTDWEYINSVSSLKDGKTVHKYELIDNNPYKGTSYYRLKLKEASGATRYSEVRSVQIADLSSFVALSPNPAINHATLTIINNISGEQAHIYVADAKSNRIFYQKARLATGSNTIELPVHTWPAGTYIVSVGTSAGSVSKKLVVQR